MPFTKTATTGLEIDVALQPLIATDDAELLDDLLRLTAAAGVEAHVATTVEAVRTRWNREELVLLGADLAPAIGNCGFVPRRDAVILTGRESAATPQTWRLAASLGVEQVALLPDGEPWLVDRISAAGTAGASSAPVVGVIAGCGGAGASVLTAGLATAAQRMGQRPTVVDLDSQGAGIEVFLAAEEATGLAWPDFANARGRLRGDTVRHQLPASEGISFVGWAHRRDTPMESGAVGSVIDALALASEIVVVDLPRSLGSLAAEALCRVDLLIVVTPKSSVGALATARIVTNDDIRAAPARLVVRGPSAGGVSAEQVADAVGIPLLAQMADDSAVTRRLERGLVPSRSRGALASTSKCIVQHVLQGQRTRTGVLR